MSSLEPTPEEIEERAQIDKSTRYPVLFFFTSAAAWLFVATLLGFASSLKLRVPDLFEEIAMLGYGRLFPSHLLAFVYGWCIQAGIGVILWLMARLSRAELRQGTTIIVIGHVWNAAVSFALIAVLFGFGRGLPYLDFPQWIWPILALSYILTVVWVQHRESPPQQRDSPGHGCGDLCLVD